MKKIAICISGGVDSSVAAFLLKKITNDVFGIFMKNWHNDHFCQNDIDLFYAKYIANQIGIELFVVDFSKEYYKRIFNKFLKELKNNLTPNPDILCNKIIKFNLLKDFAMKCLGAEFIATGHYVGIEKLKNNYFLLKSFDKRKDQSYFLNSVNQHKIKNCIFPLQFIKKQEIREIAKINKLITFDKKDSYGLCFIANKKFSKFISCYIHDKNGFIINIYGILLSKHRGLHYFTIGQRSGLNIGGRKNFLITPWYVVIKLLKYNLIIASQKHIKIKIFLIKNINFFIKLDYINCFINIQIHNIHNLIHAYLINLNHFCYKIVMFEPNINIGLGQYIGFYTGFLCLGGGEICYSIN